MNKSLESKKTSNSIKFDNNPNELIEIPAFSLGLSSTTEVKFYSENSLKRLSQVHLGFKSPKFSK